MNGIVYARTVKGQTLTFAVSGMLWEMSLVMVDEETESLWSHMLGAAMKGRLQGEDLEVIPSVITDWKSWKTNYPESTVALMSRTSSYSNDGEIRDRLAITLSINGEACQWPLPFLTNDVANDVVNNNPLVVVYDVRTFTAAIYDRRVDDQELTFDFESAGSFRDRETGSIWDKCSGKAVSGQLQGKQLTRLPGMVVDGLVWSQFHPGAATGTNPGAAVQAMQPFE